MSCSPSGVNRYLCVCFFLPCSDREDARISGRSPGGPRGSPPGGGGLGRPEPERRQPPGTLPQRYGSVVGTLGTDRLVLHCRFLIGCHSSHNNISNKSVQKSQQTPHMKLKVHNFFLRQFCQCKFHSVMSFFQSLSGVPPSLFTLTPLKQQERQGSRVPELEVE